MSKVLGFVVAAVEIGVGVATGNIGLIITGVATLAAATVAALQHAPKPEQSETAIKSPVPSRVSGYGRLRLYMAYALYATAKDGTAVDVGVFHDGRVDAIEGHYLGDKKVTVQGNGFVLVGPDGQFGDHSDLIQILTRLGAAVETAFAQVIAKLPDQWTANHRGDGCVTGAVLSGAVKAKFFQRNYPSGGPNAMPLSLVMRMQPVFDWRDTTQSVTDPATWRWSENAILHLAHYLMVRDHKDWATHFAPTLAYWTAAGNDCDNAVPLTGVQTVLTAIANKGSGHVSLLSTAGLANGMTIAISSTGNTSLTESRIVTSIAGGVIGFNGNLANDHPLGSQVTWASSASSPATEPRYRSCVAHKHTDDHKAVIANLLACCDGWISPRADGALVPYSGRYYTPTVEIGPDEIVSYSLQDGVDEENAVNQISVTYVSANHDFNAVDTDAWINADDIAARGKVLADSLSVQSPSFSQNRRLAKRVMARIMAPKRGTITTNATGRIVRGQRYVTVRLVDAGTNFFTGPVEITKLVRNIATGGVTFDWIAADPNIDAWNPATEEGLPAPVGNRVANAPLDTPVITAATVDFGAQSGDGTTGAFLRLTVAGLNRSDVTWFARTRQVGAAVWGERTYSDLAAGASVQLVTEFVPTDAMVEAEVAYQVGNGSLSDWSASATVDTRTEQTPPDAATVPTLTAWGASLDMQVTAIPRARSYRWRVYKADGTTLVGTYTASDRTFSYTAAQASRDGLQRGYVVTAAGVNAAGEGAAATSAALSNPAPAALTSVAIAGGDTTATATADASTAADLSGYVAFFGATAGFDPATSGGIATSGAPSIPIYGLAAGTYYGRVAAVDAWSSNPALLNLSSAVAFTIAVGGGSTPTGGGVNGGGYGGSVAP